MSAVPARTVSRYAFTHTHAPCQQFSAQELNKLRGMVEENQQTLVEVWDEFFGA